MSALKLEPDCTSRCRSSQHGDTMVAALTVRGASEAAKAAYLRATCSAYCQVVDTAGRSALHMAASTGCDSVARWLGQHRECNVNLKDLESGYSPLHRSVLYGQIHVATSLIQLGANPHAVDRDDLTALDHAMVDRPAAVTLSAVDPCEVYVWGTNTNYTLGIGNQDNRPLPELLETFRRQNVSIKQVAMHKFHSVFVSHDGRAWSCGHGQGGRLGLGSEQAVLAPRPLKLGVSKSLAPELCVVASISRDHTILLTEAGTVLTCGLNAHHQLGLVPPPPYVTVPAVAVRSLKVVSGVCASRFHSVVWGPGGVATFGLHAGQLGHPRSADKTVLRPKVVVALDLSNATVTQVASNDGAIVVVTDRGHVYVLHEYQCRRIASRQTDVAKVTVVGGHLDSRLERDLLVDRGGDALKVALLTTAGKLFIWQETSPQLIRCVFTVNRLLLLRDVVMTRNHLLFVTRDGEAFTGEIKPKKPKRLALDQRPQSRALETADCEVIAATRLAHAHRAVSACSDPKGRNFALIQAHPKQALLDVPEVETTAMREHMRSLLDDADEHDSIHDVVFTVGLRKFASHKFIITSRNECLGKLIADRVADSPADDNVVKVAVQDIQPDVFEQILQYIYTNECDMMTLGRCPAITPDTSPSIVNGHSEIVREDLSAEQRQNMSAFAVYSSENRKTKKNKVSTPNVSSEWDPVRVVQRSARRLNMQELCTELDGFAHEDGFIVPKNKRGKPTARPSWHRTDDDPLHDVTIRSADGRQMGAHKCVLAARLEYFHSMLSQGWSETSGGRNALSLALPYEVLRILLDFLYEDEVEAVRGSEDVGLWSNVLVVADQLFVQRLKEQCEVALAGLLTLKNVAEMLQTADTYNAPQLKACCMQYVCLNLGAVLESRCLENVSREVLARLSLYYRDLNPAVSKRLIAPLSFAPTVHTLGSALQDNPFTFDQEDSIIVADNIVKRALKQAKKKTRVRKNSNEASKTVRTRVESTSSIVSEDLDQIVESFGFNDIVEKSPANEDISASVKENTEKNSQWVKIPASSKQQKIVQARLKAINMSKDSYFIAESSRESFTRLTRNSPSPVPAPAAAPVPNPLPERVSPLDRAMIPTTGITSLDFPDLCSPPNSQHKLGTHSKTDKAVPKKVVKISQKQRKRLTSISDIGLMADHLDAINQSPPPPPPAWGRHSLEAGAESGSLVDIIRQELRQVRISPAVPVERVPVERVPARGAALNPWSKVATPQVVSPGQKPAVSFTAIVADEKKQKDNLTKMLSKPLELTQIEDKAISDLLQFYNASGATEERITVQRVNAGPIAVPTWITNH